MRAAVIDDLKPRAEQPVELGQRHAVVDLDEELIADGPEEAFDFAFRRGRAGARVDQFHAQNRAGPQQLRGDERRAAVDENRVRDAPCHQPGSQRRFQAEDVLAGAPPPADQQP